jgi:DNA-binding LacI/PurR family transcriptional regulator
MVAKEAGVTPTTVSCVLNNTRPVSEKVRKKVMDAIEKLNYVPDMNSRAMQGKGAKQIAVMVDSIKNPFLAELVCGLEEAGIKKGFFFNICGKMDLKKYIPNIIARKIDAVYFCSEIKNDETQYVRHLLDNGIKVLTGSHFTHFAGEISRIDMATGSAVQSAVRLLHEKGHTKIAFLNTFRADSGLDDRLNAYLSTMEELGLAPIFVSPEHTIPSTIENGKKLFVELIESHGDTTAIIGLNDLVALGAMNEAQRRGYTVPDDISFIGIDGIELAGLAMPRLTTFWSNATTLGHKAFDMLYKMIKNGEILSFNHEMTYVEGETVKDLAKGS